MLILASASNARHRLLLQVGIDHDVIVSNINEESFYMDEVKDLVTTLATEKAKNVAFKILKKYSETKYFRNIEAVLGCDSLFEFNGIILGKPSNQKEAIQRLKALSSQSGFLHTGHCLLDSNFSKDACKFNFINNIQTDVITTKIVFSSISDIEIEKYVSSGESLQCAGGFSLDGKGASFIQSIEGCYSNVIGLSLPWLTKAIKEAKNKRSST